MLLAFDVGNTNIVVGLFKDNELVDYWRMATHAQKTADEMGIFLLSVLREYGTDIHDVIVASVVPHIMYSFHHMIQKYFRMEAIMIEPGIKTGINIKYDNPKQVGADRIVNAVAGLEKYGGPMIIIDFGTATTFCAITADRVYLGGAILPGIKISSDALYERAAKLTRVELVKPAHAICTNTMESVQSGIIYGYVGSVDHIVRLMKEEMNVANIKVIATGGLSTLIAKESNTIDLVDKNLTLEGLNIIYHMNKNNKNVVRGLPQDQKI